jgi:hypothetical protein
MDAQFKILVSFLILVEIARLANELIVVNRNYKTWDRNLEAAYTECGKLRAQVKNLNMAVEDMISGKLVSYVMTPSGFKVMTGISPKDIKDNS